MEINKNFVGSRMNKSLDERLLKPGEYIDAMNIRISSPEGSEAGSAENAKGTEKLVTLTHNGLPLSNPVCIGAFEDGENETIYWFVTSDNVDMIVSYNENTSSLIKHVVSTTVLNFSDQNLVNGINLVDDLLFFTDNFNQPRKINVTRTYPVPVSGVDQITEDDISVIVKPPVESPSLTLSLNNTKENYLEDKFIRFAYRYKYVDGEYSALSEFSDLGFNPLGFRLDFGTFDNIGMLNRFNEALVTINTGSKNVVGVDICFKQSNSNTVNVIERFNKADQGWADNMLYTLTFNNQKIYTALQDSEILRLFDNVPKRAKTQTSIGNRIIYGNYVDGYDIDTTIRMTAFGISEDATDDFIQTVDDDTSFQLLLQDTELVEGKTISVNLNLISQGFTGATYPGNENDYNDSWAFTLLRDYDDAADLATSQEFIDAIVLGDTFATADQGYSMTDRFFASIVAQSPFDKISTVDSNNIDNTGFAISHTTHTITITIPGVKYEDPANPGAFAYETFHISSPQATIFSDNQRRSFHSNRDYEVGIEYLDEYGRASTALVSENNTVFFDASKSTKQNKIRVQLDHLAPSWASRYRFVVKPSKTDYETIYSTFWLPLDQDASYWVRLEGDNQTKAQVGDLLIVKKYGEAAASSLVKTKILDLKVQPQGFISGDAQDAAQPTGLYMRIKPSGFAIKELDSDDIFDKFDSDTTSGGLHFCVSEANPDHAPGSGTLEFRPIAIPAGTRIELMFRSFRFGSYDYDYAWKQTYISNYDFDSLYDFMKNTNIDFSDPYIDSGYLGGPVGGNSPGANHITFVESLGNGNDVILGFFGVANTLSSTTGISHGKYFRVTDPAGENVEREMKVRFYEDPATGRLWITSDSMNNGTGRRPNRNEMGVTIIKGGDPLVFETEPVNNDNEIYYQSHKSYPIVNRNHTGNVTNQNASLGIGAVVDLEMFDCFSFGNGVESYKIRDGLAKPGFKLGARVTSVSEQDYKEAHRRSDITYSGVYNEETNINKLNEFNLGLANFKTLEQSFGPINVLHGRQTDILVLQEDKVSYVLAGKNILSDAVGGGTLVSVPEVLGQQVARVEEYGCSDIESFASYGGNVFFTDEKRGAVINLKGGNRNEQLNVISSLGMRSWFRDRFIEYKSNIKLGCYDPYMDEYVLTFTDSTFTQGLDTLECGTEITQYNSNTATTFNVDLGSAIGTSTITYNVSEGSALISVVYASSTVVNQTITGSGTIDFVKSDIETELCTVTITPTNATFSLSVGCVTDESLTIFRIVKNTGDMAGLTATHDSRWVSPSPLSTVTPPITIPVTFLEGPVSQWHTSVGLAGYGQFPTDGSTIRMRHIGGGGTAEWEFDRFKYLVSDTLYTQDEIDTLMPLLNTAGEIETSITAIPGDTYEAEFTYSNPNGYRYLYLVWDYVEPEIECNAVSSTYNVDGIGRYETIVNMPNVRGDVTFTFDVGDKPARIYLQYLGDIVADSLFIGNDLPDATLESEITSITGSIQSYDYIGNGEFGETYIVYPTYTSSDIAVSDGSETRANGSGTGQVGVVADYPSSTALASDGQIKLTFFKSATTDLDNPYEPANQVKVVIYSVNSGANTWNMTTGCPVELPDSSQPGVTDFVCSNTTVNSGNNGKALYNIDAEVGTGEGAVVVTVRPDFYNRELAMKAEKGSQVYNDVVSSFDGFHSASSYTDYTAVGDNTLSNTSAPELVWDGSAFTATGNTESVTLQSSLSSFPLGCANAPTYTMVIPKTETNVTSINLKVLAFDDVNITVKCPTYLTGVRVHGPYTSPLDAVNGNTATLLAYKTNVGSKLGYSFNGNANNILHNEQLFTDPFGQNKLSTGWYYTEFIWKESIFGGGGSLTNTFYVDSNGVTQYYDDDGSPCDGVIEP